MKAINGLLVSLVAGSCVTAAMAGQDDVTKFIQPKVMNKVRMVGQIGGGSGFGTRAATKVDYYSNVATSLSSTNSWIFYGGTTTTGDVLHLEKGGFDSQANQIGPVASAAKIGEVEFWIVASDGTANTNLAFDTTVTMEMFDQVVDWLPAGSTCMPSGNDAVNQVSLGGFYVDITGTLAPVNGYANGYVLPISDAGITWVCNHGTCFLDQRIWEYNGGNPPTTLAASQFNTFDGQAVPCAAPGDYPELGYSADNFYFDANNNGIYSAATERYWFGGGGTFISNLMVRLAGDDGCSFDLNGDGFVGGSDIDYALELIDAGCPY